jgi:hypothetical protein
LSISEAPMYLIERDGIFESHLKRERSCGRGDLEMFADFCLSSSSCIDFIFKAALWLENILFTDKAEQNHNFLLQSSLNALQFLNRHMEGKKPLEN